MTLHRARSLSLISEQALYVQMIRSLFAGEKKLALRANSCVLMSKQLQNIKSTKLQQKLICLRAQQQQQKSQKTAQPFFQPADLLFGARSLARSRARRTRGCCEEEAKVLAQSPIIRSSSSVRVTVAIRRVSVLASTLLGAAIFGAIFFSVSIISYKHNHDD